MTLDIGIELVGVFDEGQSLMMRDADMENALRFCRLTMRAKLRAFQQTRTAGQAAQVGSNLFSCGHYWIYDLAEAGIVDQVCMLWMPKLLCQQLCI